MVPIKMKEVINESTHFKYGCIQIKKLCCLSVLWTVVSKAYNGGILTFWYDSFDTLLEVLEEKTHTKPEVVLEATGRYSKPIVDFFQLKGYAVIELNPLETHQMRKQSIRKVKTHFIDLDRIAQSYYLNDFVRGPEMEPAIQELRNLCRQHIRFNKFMSPSYRHLIELTPRLFNKNDDPLFKNRSRSYFNRKQ